MNEYPDCIQPKHAAKFLRVLNQVKWTVRNDDIMHCLYYNYGHAIPGVLQAFVDQINDQFEEKVNHLEVMSLFNPKHKQISHIVLDEEEWGPTLFYLVLRGPAMFKYDDNGIINQVNPRTLVAAEEREGFERTISIDTFANSRTILFLFKHKRM